MVGDTARVQSLPPGCAARGFPLYLAVSYLHRLNESLKPDSIKVNLVTCITPCGRMGCAQLVLSEN